MNLHSILSSVTPEMLNERWGSVVGSEHEFGVLNKDGENSFDSSKLPTSEFTTSGARIYNDMGHPEGSSPEASNPLQLIPLERGLALKVLSLKLDAELYKNCVDFRGGVGQNHTFAAHSNYFTSAPRPELDLLIPFFVSQIIYIGAGDTSHGEEELHLSQRAPFITCLHSHDTLSSRPLINDRDERLSSVPGYYRLHLIQHDANMCEAALLLKHGTTMLMLRLLEEEKLTPLPYNNNKAIEDLHSINRLTSGWKLSGTLPSSISAIDVQGYYLNQVVAAIPYPTPLEKVVIDLWAETLKALDTDKTKTIGIVDWSTKEYLFELLGSEGAQSFETIQSMDLEYHNINPKKGLHYALESDGVAPRLVDPKTVKYHINNPPKTTRAFCRGKAVKMEKSLRKNNSSYYLSPDWDLVYIINGESNKRINSLDLDDPRDPYAEKFEQLKKKLGL